MQKVAITADVRRDNGKGVARKLRAQGLIPAVLYGGDGPPVSLKLVRRDLALVMQGHEGHHLLVDLAVKDDQGAGENPLVFLQELDVNPITHLIEHADFWRVDATKPIHTTVAIHLSGTPIGVRQGGVYQQVLREIDIEALPVDIPEKIEMEISNMAMGQALHVSDIPSEGIPYAILTPGDRVICTVHAPRAMAAETAATPEEGAGSEGQKS